MAIGRINEFFVIHRNRINIINNDSNISSDGGNGIQNNSRAWALVCFLYKNEIQFKIVHIVSCLFKII